MNMAELIPTWPLVTFAERIFFLIMNKQENNELNVRKKPEYLERTTDHGQATGKLYHLRLRVECILYVIYKGGSEPMPYW
jgi:hypothetical protein